MYQWAYPSDWLAAHVDKLAEAKDVPQLRALINHLMRQLTEDDIQDIFQEEMDRDGYFNEEEN